MKALILAFLLVFSCHAHSGAVSPEGGDDASSRLIESSALVDEQDMTDELLALRGLQSPEASSMLLGEISRVCCEVRTREPRTLSVSHTSSLALLGLLQLTVRLRKRHRVQKPVVYALPLVARVCLRWKHRQHYQSLTSRIIKRWKHRKDNR